MAKANNPHNLRGPGGRFIPKQGTPQRTSKRRSAKPLTKTLVNEEPKKLRNYITILLDSSGSIGAYGLEQKMRDAYNNQIATIKEQSYESGQETFFSLYVFGVYSYNGGLGGMQYGGRQIERRAFATHIEQAPFLTSANYKASGNTPLVHCIEAAIQELSQVKDANDSNTSFLLMVMTDGEDTESQYNSVHKAEVARLIREKTRSDRWTFACAGPQSAKQSMLSLGFPEGNLHLWEQTQKGAEQMAFASNVGTQAYFSSRSAGQTSVKSFYQTDLSKVSPQAIKNLQNFNNKFRGFVITDKDCTGVNQNNKPSVDIAEFIKNQGLQYQVGKAFYELTKTEEIHGHKELAIKHLKTGEVYGGHEAKTLLGLPTDKTFKVKPGNHTDYKVFCQSTSMNRKLLAGTEVLYRVS
jgi:hypothetical protein